MADGELVRRIYILDASVWIAADGNPTSNRIRAVLDRLLSERRLKSPKQVFEELKRAGAYSDWAKDNRRSLSYPPRMNNDYAQNAGMVQHRFPAMGGALSAKNRADPWVVAAAITENANGVECYVVTTETANNRPNRKIAGVCANIGVTCINLDDLLEEEGEDD